MRYRADELQKLRDRWRLPLGGSSEESALQVDGCRSFQELLSLRLAPVHELSAAARARAGEAGEIELWRGALRGSWEEQSDGLFGALLQELQFYGLPEVAAIEAARYEIRDPADLRGADLRGLVLCGAYLENAHFEGADLTGASLDGARCFESHFEQASCQRVSFLGAECHFASFQDALLDHADFAKADCTMVRFQRARLRHASFEAAICYAAQFDGAFLAKAALDSMYINHFTRFGRPGEQGEAERTRAPRREAKEEGDDWFIVELFPTWLRAAEVCSRIRFLLKSHGYFLEADEYQYLEMVCRRHLMHKNKASEFCEWLFKDLMFGYGLKWKRPLISVLSILVLWGVGFAAHFHNPASDDLLSSLGYGLYYSIISFTTLGFGNAPDLEGIWSKLLLCSEALLGTILMPLFLLAYARKILQD